MSYNTNHCERIFIDGSKRYQKIDGFGVNINSKYWNNGQLIPTVDILIQDLGATIFRVDAYGKSNWVDPDNKFDAGILKQETYDRIYQGTDFMNFKAMCRYLNSKGIEPYITISGIVPSWMCASDGKTLTCYREFAEMAASYAYWVRHKAGIKFHLFGPLNETDLGPPEGPFVSPEEFPKVCEELVEAFDRRGLSDIKLVVAEQAVFNLDYISYISKSRKLDGRIGAFGMHCYNDQRYEEVMEFSENSSLKDSSVWMTEYGDLDCTGEKEWYIAWISFVRLMNLLEDGMNAALSWNAFDDYHDHDEAWNIFGLLRSARNIYTPKKRYYSVRHAYRYILPGFERIESKSSGVSLRTLAFSDVTGKEFTIIGMNEGSESTYLEFKLKGLQLEALQSDVNVYVTTADNNGLRTAGGRIRNDEIIAPGMDVIIPGNSIFTITTVK